MAFLEEFSHREELAFEKGYTIDDEGNVYGLRGNKLKGFLGSNGYKTFNFLDENNKIIHVTYHRFQAYCKYGDKIYEKGILVRHLDGNPTNNSASNIALGTQSDNMFDQPKEVRIRKASNANKVYSDELVEQIIKDHENGLSYREIMNKYNISSKGTLSYIINKRLRN